MTNLARLPPLGQKTKPCVSTSLRRSARMQPCALRIPGVCNGRLDTTVLCHLRLFNNAGIGQKPHDLHAVYGCAACHRVLDSRGWMTSGEIGFEDILRALMETQSRMLAAGLIQVLP